MEHEIPDTPYDRDTERLRAFLRFVLRQDYNYGPHARLYAEDRGHFATMNNRLRDIKEKRYNSTQKATLQAYFWKHLRQPCMRLGVPYQSILTIIRRFFKFMKDDGRYESAVENIMLDFGLEAVATKIYLDETVIIPAVFASNEDELRDMLAGSNAMAKRWFTTIEGIFSEAARSQPDTSWTGAHRVQYVLNRQGQEVQVARQMMVGQGDSTESGGPNTWAATVTDSLARWWRSE